MLGIIPFAFVAERRSPEAKKIHTKVITFQCEEEAEDHPLPWTPFDFDLGSGRITVKVGWTCSLERLHARSPATEAVPADEERSHHQDAKNKWFSHVMERTSRAKRHPRKLASRECGFCRNPGAVETQTIVQEQHSAELSTDTSTRELHVRPSSALLFGGVDAIPET
jgi:hypothetical protein